MNIWQVINSFILDWQGQPDVLPSSGRGVALDLGCGSAQRYRGKIEKAGFKWVGLDLSPGHGDRVTIGDAHVLPFPDESFDCIVCPGTLQYLSRPWVALQEVHRCLKRGGDFVGNVALLGPWPSQWMGYTCYYGFHPDGLDFLLRDSGFVDVNLYPGILGSVLVTRQWWNVLLGGRRGEKIAFSFVNKLLFRLPLGIYLVAGGLKRALFGENADYRKTLEWLKGRAALEFAGHIYFSARKEGGLSDEHPNS